MGTRASHRATTLLLIGALVGGCTGVVGLPEGDRGPHTSTVAPGDLAGARVRRLTETEFDNTLSVLLGEDYTAVTFPPESFLNGYDNHADQLTVSGLLAERLFHDARELASTLADRILAAPSCTPSGPTDEACARELLETVATRAYRRPAAAVELDDLIVVFRVGAEGADFRNGLSVALEVVLQSAEVLYHTELGEGGPSDEQVTLTPYEIANAVAYSLTGAPPDDDLLADAANGSLLDPEVRAEHAARLVSNEQSFEVLGDFGVRWIEVYAVESLTRDDPEWPTIRSSAYQETRRFVATAIQRENATFATLLTAEWTVADDTMASFYGLSADGDGRITFPAGERSGILSHASVLADNALHNDTAPVHRGVLVRRRLLCQDLAGPPQNLTIRPPVEDASLTSRQRWEATTRDNPTCWSCHNLVDPIGFAFEHYDSVGRYRSTDAGQPVDAASSLTDTDVDRSYDDLRGLATALSESPDARACFARNWLEFAVGRRVEQPTVNSIATDFIAGQGTVRDLMVQVVRSDAFIRRTGGN